MIGGKGLFSHFTRAKVVDRNVRTTEESLCSPVPGKVFAHLILDRVKDKLLSVRRPEQSGFTPKRSTVDRIALLNLLLKGRREHSRPLWIAYVDLRAAFDSVDRTALWLLLQSIGIPVSYTHLTLPTILRV